MKRISLLLSFVFITAAAGFFLSVHTKVAGQNAQNDRGWKLWVRASPCASGRPDWIVVARDNPTTRGGSGFFYAVDQFFPSATCAIHSRVACTLAQATAEAATFRASPEYFKHCCREYSVWQNNQTGQMTVVVGKFGTAGFGWRRVQPDLCCEEAESLAGITGVCSAGTAGASGSVGDLSGSWTIVQTDTAGGVHSGILKVNMSGNGLSGSAEWQNHAAGNIRGQVTGRAIHFEVHYGGGLVGFYDGQVSGDGNQMFNGKGHANRGSATVTWIATRLTGGVGRASQARTGRNRTGTNAQNPTSTTTADAATEPSGAGNPGDAPTGRAQNWAGNWSGSYQHIVNISGGGNSISASFRYQQTGASGSGSWSNCRVTGNTAECYYTATHDDATKSGSRRGKVRVTLSGDTLTAAWYEDAPQWSYKPGHSAASVSSSMYKGAVFNMTFKRQ